MLGSQTSELSVSDYAAVSMGRRNTSSKSIWRSLNGQSRLRVLIQAEQPPCLVLIEYTLGHIGSLVEALSDQLIRWCCIDQLSWHDAPGIGGV
jgi:hypothetical protein